MNNLYLTKGSLPTRYFGETADYIASVQNKDGSIPWFQGSITDPWDHTEAAMGLSIMGHVGRAENAYLWLADAQLDDGSWWAAYKNGTTHRDRSA